MTRTLLVVDDEPGVANGLAALFRRRGYDVRVALTAQMALNLVREVRIDGAIIDFLIPDMRGDVLFAAAVAIQPHLETHTVFLTGDISDAALTALSEHGAHIVLKPFDVPEFERIVAEVIDSASDVDDRDSRGGSAAAGGG